MKEVVREEGHVNPEFLEKHKLSKTSRCYDFSDAMVPLVSKYNSNGGKAGGFLFAQLTTWLNSKAMLANAGEGGVCYSFTMLVPPTIQCYMH